MSIRLVIDGYILSLVAAIVGCIVIARSRIAVRGLGWLISSLSAALVTGVLFTCRSLIPDFFSIVLANEAMLISFVLLHQAILAILNSSRRYLLVSVGLAIGLFAAFIYGTYISDDIGVRVLARTAAIVIQILISTVVVFTHRDSALRSPLRVLGWALIAFNTMQVARFASTLIWRPSPDLLHPDAVQAFFSFLNCILGLSNCLAVVWLALWSQRHDLQTVALTDELSGLMNRRAFDQILEHELRRAYLRSEKLALLMIDLDSFKSVNDDHGHQTGDEVIRQVSRVLQMNTRSVDKVARYGGEEFAMLLRNSQLEEAEVVAERLRTEIAAIRKLPRGVRITASIGVAVCSRNDTTESLVKRSDDAMYFSKRSGRNRVSVELV